MPRKPRRPKRVMIDFDGVIMQRGDGRKGKPIDGAIDAIKHLRQMGYEAMVFSTRAAHDGEKDIKDWLDSHNVTVDGITGRKLDADYYIDDKAIAFSDWSSTLKAL